MIPDGGRASSMSAHNWETYMVYTGLYRIFDPQVVHNLFKLCYPGVAYFVMTPQAMRSPAFPAGSVFRSSALA